jgi:predicted dehydrogenase
VVDRDDIDVIDITAPNSMHQVLVEAATAAGKHVFCEKPVGINPLATAAIEAAARRSGAITGCGYNYRWAPMVQYTKKLIEDGRFGNLTHYRGRFFSMYGRDRLGLLSWRFLQDQAGNGALTDIMSHTVDMALHLAGPIKRVVAVKETFVKQRPLPMPGVGTHYDRGKPEDPKGAVTNEDYVGALVEFENGVRGTLEADRSIFGPQSSMAFELNGSAGAASWDHEKLNQLRLYLAEEQPTDGFIEVLSGDAFPHQGSIVPGGGNSIGYEDLKLIEALEYLKSVAAGHPHHPGFDDPVVVVGGVGGCRQFANRLIGEKSCSTTSPRPSSLPERRWLDALSVIPNQAWPSTSPCSDGTFSSSTVSMDPSSPATSKASPAPSS